MSITIPQTADEARTLYPCDICHMDVEVGEKVHVTDNGLTVEHVDCTRGWFRSNYGRESL